MIATSLDMSADVQGSIYSIGDIGDALVNSGRAGIANSFTDGQQFTISVDNAYPGYITLGTTADSTGAITWSLTYRKKTPTAFVF